MYADRHPDHKGMKKFAPALQGASMQETCQNIWEFWKKHVKYTEDGIYKQDVQSPQQLFYSGKGDCKSLSVAVASCLRALGIPYSYRFVSFSNEPKPTH